MKCKIEECDKEEFSRGLCKDCYNAARHYIIKNKLSWNKLIEDGFANKSKLPRKREKINEFIKKEIDRIHGLPYQQHIADIGNKLQSNMKNEVDHVVVHAVDHIGGPICNT